MNSLNIHTIKPNSQSKLHSQMKSNLNSYSQSQQQYHSDYNSEIDESFTDNDNLSEANDEGYDYINALDNDIVDKYESLMSGQPFNNNMVDPSTLLYENDPIKLKAELAYLEEELGEQGIYVDNYYKSSIVNDEESDLQAEIQKNKYLENIEECYDEEDVIALKKGPNFMDLLEEKLDMSNYGQYVDSNMNHYNTNQDMNQYNTTQGYSNQNAYQNQNQIYNNQDSYNQYQNNYQNQNNYQQGNHYSQTNHPGNYNN